MSAVSPCPLGGFPAKDSLRNPLIEIELGSLKGASNPVWFRLWSVALTFLREN